MSIQNDLMVSNIKEALDKATKLPQDIREGVLKDWIKKTTDRVEVETVLEEIYTGLMPSETPKANEMQTEGKS